jgi:hypothetical protein
MDPAGLVREPRRPRWLRFPALLIALLATLSPAPALAAWVSPPVLAMPRPPPARVRGRPKIVLDQLEFPSDLAQAPQYKSHLRKTLAKVTRRADWGAGAKNRIEYRFFVTELALIEGDGVLHVRCTAIGRLPKGKAAKSRLSFSGDPRLRNDLVKRVLDIVARGVITRLAELERVRRGELQQSGVRAPRSEPTD